jgi:spermidine synthase
MLPDRRDTPLSYYARSGPLGQIFDSLHPGAHGSIAVVGLGAGSALCYQGQGQQWTIYEIDPAVDRIARDPHLFRFIGDCAPQTRTVIGDARLSLQQAPDNTYALMILDAYSADYVPVHLITREALSLYLAKMTNQGILAFHTSSFWIDLAPVLTSLARNAGLACYVEHDTFLSMDEARRGKFASTWFVMAHKASDVEALIRNPRWRPCGQTTFPVWTDDYSSLVTVIPVHFSIGPQY